MKRLGNQRGQAMVEAVGSFWILVMLFFWVYCLSVLALDKLRSLDTAYHLARAQQVADPNQSLSWMRTSDVINWCYGTRGLIPQPRRKRSTIGGWPTIDEVAFRYRSISFGAPIPLGLSVMRVVEPDARFLTHSWPEAHDDSLSATALGTEWARLQAQMAPNQDMVEDGISDGLDTANAG